MLVPLDDLNSPPKHYFLGRSRFDKLIYASPSPFSSLKEVCHVITSVISLELDKFIRIIPNMEKFPIISQLYIILEKSLF